MNPLPRLASAAAHLREWVSGFWKKRRAVTEHQTETARETRVALGLMAEASAAPDQTDEQRMFLSRAAPGMRAREAVLLGIPNRSSVEENELHMIRREMAAMEGRSAPEGWVSRPQARPVRFVGAFASIAPMLPYLLVGAVALSVTGWGASWWNGFKAHRLEQRVERLTEQRDAPCTAAELEGHTTRAACEALALAQAAVADAGEISRSTAEALEAERQRAARAAARERRRQREVQDVLTNGPPPAWRLRDDDGEDGGSGSSAATGDPASLPRQPR